MSSQSTEKIKVFARIRPSKETHVQKVVHIADNCINVGLDGDSKPFQFDGLFGEDSNQEEVFDGAASRIVHGTLQGYNGTIFAYGQTGSGKTHTMIGPSSRFDEESGIIPRGLHLLFEQLDKKREELPGIFSAKITISFVEIHNENIYDLFLMNEEKLKIGQDHDGNAMVKGATEIFVKDLNDAMEEVRRGWNNRSVAETAMNRHSSRSHALLLIKIRTEEVHGDNTTDRISTARSAFLNLVDLAGSERVSQSKVEGERFKETTNINKSLLQLKIVIRELSENHKKNAFIAFRNSVLTHILKDSLGGNARTAVMINVHPDKKYYSETLSTLQFSAEVRRIENKVVVNEDLKGDSVNAYKAEIRRLQEEMENMKNRSEAELAEAKRNVMAWTEAANKFERQLAVARRTHSNIASVARKNGQGAVDAATIWDRSMSEIAESARKLPISDINTMKLRELTADLENCTFEKEELQEQLKDERKAKMELQEKLKRIMEGAMSPMRAPKGRAASASSQDEEPSVSSMLGSAHESQLFATPSSAARKERRRTRYTPARDRQSNFFRPVLDVDGDNEELEIPMQQTESFEEKELKLELEVNTQKQIIDEKTRECESLTELLQKAEGRVAEAEEKHSTALSTGEEKVKELTAEIEKAKRTIGEENEKLIQLEKRANEIESELMEANGQVERLRSDMELLKSTHEDEMNQLEKNLKSNLSDKEKKEVDLKREMEELRATVESNRVDLANKETEKKAAEDVLALLRDRIVEAEKEKSERMTEMESMASQMEALKEASENERKEMDEKMKEEEEKRTISEDDHRRKINELKKEIEMKSKELEKECERRNQMGEASSTQLAQLQQEMNNLRIEKDKETMEKINGIRHWTNVSAQFSEKIDEMKAELTGEKIKREESERNERRTQEILRLHATQNEELKENIAVLGSHNNTKQKQHVLSRYVEDKRLLTLRIAQLESVMEKHGLTVPKADHDEGHDGEGERSRATSPRDSVSSDIAMERVAPPSRRATRATAGAAPSASAASSSTSVRSSRTTTAGNRK